MKFVPRQPNPPTEHRSVVRATTTRFLRLRPAEEVEREEAGAQAPPAVSARTETRSLFMPAETASLPLSRMASQRVRLRLDPEVATQPLPESQWPAFPPVAAPPDLASPETVPAATEEEAAPSPIDPVLPAPPEEAIEEEAFPAEFPVTSEVEATYEPVAEQAAPAHVVQEESPAPVVTPVGPDSSWLREKKRLARPTPPVALNVRSGAASPISLSKMARGERGAPRRRFASLGAVKEPTAPSAAPEMPAVAATDSRSLPRPELRRAAPLPLAAMARPERSLGPGFWIVLALVIVLLGAVLYFFGAVPRLVGFFAPRAPAPVAVAERAVTYVVARQIVAPVVLPLSGKVESFQQTALYARTTGYVRDWLVDIGDPVKAGQVMAELDTPDVDHQLTQARATSDEAKAKLALAQDEAKRWDTMAAAHAVSQQDADEKDSARDEAQAGFNAAQASVARLVDLELFKEIRAPYAGRVIARNLEVGTLVAAGPGLAGSELFRVAQTDPVRVFVDVPEANARAIRPGLTARIVVDSAPERVFSGTVVRDAGVLDATTHTLRTELSVANPDGALLPGAQARVRLQLGESSSVVLVPIDTLVAQRDGVAVARLTDDGGREVVHFTLVTVGRDFGSEVEVLDHVQEGDRLVSHPPADLRDGTAVNARPLEQAPFPSLLPPKPSAPRA
jgi:membrane fusion protein (multidrug efflux system)